MNTDTTLYSLPHQINPRIYLTVFCVSYVPASVCLTFFETVNLKKFIVTNSLFELFGSLGLTSKVEGLGGPSLHYST